VAEGVAEAPEFLDDVGHGFPEIRTCASTNSVRP
jgi:hypothetical protein